MIFRAAQQKSRSLRVYYTFIVLLVLGFLSCATLYASKTYRDYFISYLTKDLEYHSSSLATAANEDSSFKKLPTQICDTRFGRIGERITVIDIDGSVVCDSAADPKSMDNHANRPELKQALLGKSSSKIRLSHTVKDELLYVAVPIFAKGKVSGAVRSSIPLTLINKHLANLSYQLFLVGGIITTVVGIISVLVYRLISRSLAEIRLGAEQIALGHFDHQLPRYKITEVQELASAMNKMRRQLKQLEKIRRDFVAHVSHELKTPITSIKGFTETLLEGAKETPEDLDRFLGIISKESNRLEAIIGDLLTLSRLETEGGAHLLDYQKHNLSSIVKSAMEICSPKATEKKIDLVTESTGDLEVLVDRNLIEQALVNLISNAVTYSDEGDSVTLQVEHQPTHALIKVIDHGRGIEQKHLPRLFERFYRVDKARSRGLGGTGLGLAIVKHIVGLHAGRVRVESKLGEGSTFSIFLPISGQI